MDFDEHDDPEEEIGGMSVQESPYDDSPSPPPLGNSSASRAGLPHNGAGNISKMGGPGEPGSATVGQQQNQLGSMSGGGSSHNRSKPPGSGSASAGGKYKECLKNHAVGIGGHAVDGCGEFLPAGEEGTMDALRCAACNCHRNFHRRELDPGTIPPLALLDLGGGSSGSAAYHHAAAAAHHYPSPAAAYYPRTPGSAGGGYLHHPQAQQPALHYHHPHFQSSGGRPLALPSTSGGGGSRDEQEGDMLQAMSGGGGGSSGMMMMMGMSGSGSGSGKNKRFRTKFSQEQKDKMLAFSERLGWRIQKHDEAAVQEFCAETGIKRHVLKLGAEHFVVNLSYKSSCIPYS